MASVRARWWWCVRQANGWTVVDLLFVVAICAICAGFAVVPVVEAVAAAREWGAVRYVAARVRMARGEAVQRSRAVALQFVRDADSVRFRLCADGDGDGVRTADLSSGTDEVLEPFVVLEQLFSGMTFGVAVSAPGVDEGDAAVESGSDPVRIGSADMLTFGVDGVGASGTLFIRSVRGRQFAVRINGATGRVRTFEYLDGQGRWVEH